MIDTTTIVLIVITSILGLTAAIIGIIHLTKKGGGPAPCKPQCPDNFCGDNKCGVKCACEDGQYCEDSTSTCETCTMCSSDCPNGACPSGYNCVDGTCQKSKPQKTCTCKKDGTCSGNDCPKKPAGAPKCTTGCNGIKAPANCSDYYYIKNDCTAQQCHIDNGKCSGKTSKCTGPICDGKNISIEYGNSCPTTNARYIEGCVGPSIKTKASPGHPSYDYQQTSMSPQPATWQLESSSDPDYFYLKSNSSSCAPNPQYLSGCHFGNNTTVITEKGKFPWKFQKTSSPGKYNIKAKSCVNNPSTGAPSKSLPYLTGCRGTSTDENILMANLPQSAGWNIGGN